MNINYQTDHLIIINYPAGAGGKFISLCLALSENVLHQDYILATLKLKSCLKEIQSFRISSAVMNKSIKENNHFELGCIQLAGFNVYSKDQQEVLSNVLWKECTNQKKYFFCMMNNSNINRWNDYPNAKHIILKNYTWILKKRNLEKKDFQTVNKDTFKNYIDFNMESLLEKNSFLNCFDSLCNFLKIEIKNKTLLEDLRLTFLKTFKIGF